jgi:NADH:ubiquinone oxidoreductase subunit 3 (subunit A)
MNSRKSPNRSACSGISPSGIELLHRWRKADGAVETTLKISIYGKAPSSRRTPWSAEDMNESPYLFLTVFLIAAIVFTTLPLGLAYAWARKYSPAKPGADKNATYECGLESKGDAWVQFKSEYYLYAIIFMIFDVEAVFLLPFAVSFLELSRQGIGALAAITIFLALLGEGLVWAWQKGVLTWE